MMAEAMVAGDSPQAGGPASGEETRSGLARSRREVFADMYDTCMPRVYRYINYRVGNASLAGEASLRLEDTLNKITVSMQISGPQRNDLAGSVPAALPPGTFTADAESIKSLETPPRALLPSNVANVDPALLDLLKEYAVRDQAKLQILLDRLPENTRLIVMHALESYETILNTQPGASNISE